MQSNSQLIESMLTISKLMKDNMSFSTDLTKLSLGQIHALIFLKNHKSARMKEIAEHFTIELPSATSLLNKLHNLGLVRRQQDALDRRVVRIELTQKGATLLQEAMEERKKKIASMLSHLSQTDKTHLLRILDTIVTKLEKNHEK